MLITRQARPEPFARRNVSNSYDRPAASPSHRRGRRGPWRLRGFPRAKARERRAERPPSRAAAQRQRAVLPSPLWRQSPPAPRTPPNGRRAAPSLAAGRRRPQRLSPRTALVSTSEAKVSLPPAGPAWLRLLRPLDHPVLLGLRSFLSFGTFFSVCSSIRACPVLFLFFLLKKKVTPFVIVSPFVTAKPSGCSLLSSGFHDTLPCVRWALLPGGPGVLALLLLRI